MQAGALSTSRAIKLDGEKTIEFSHCNAETTAQECGNRHRSAPYFESDRSSSRESSDVKKLVKAIGWQSCISPSKKHLPLNF